MNIFKIKNCVILFSLLTACFTNILGQEKVLGYWAGTMIKDNAAMNISIEFKNNDGKIFGYFNSPVQKASGIPLDNISVDDSHISFQLMTEPVTLLNVKSWRIR